jgi:hypothetical protein
MKQFFPVIELVDRYCIALLKFHKTKSNYEELDFYTCQLENYDLLSVKSELDNLYNIHSCIWELEAELKSGVEHQLSLETIGQRAISIRNWNNQRVALKNQLAEKLGCAVREIKQQHLSE